MSSPAQPAAAPALRMFIAVELPPAVKQQVQDEQRRLRQLLAHELHDDPFRWTSVDNLHLTLRFLGNTTPEQRVRMETSLLALTASAGSFRLAVQGMGAFPSLRKPNIIWLDFGGDLPALSSLQAEIEQAAQLTGFAGEQRAFAPHLTIARAQKNALPATQARAGDLLRQEAARPLSHPALFLVDQIHLIRSDLRPSGSVYHSLAAFHLRT